MISWRQDTHHNNIQHNDTQHNDIQYNNTQHNVMYCYSECHLWSVSIMLSVTNKLIILSVIMLNDVMLSVVTLNVVAPISSTQPRPQILG